MTALALVFMLASWSFVLGLTAWCFRRVLRSERAASDGNEPPQAGARGDPDPR